MFVLLSAATPSRLLTAFPPGVRVSRVPLDEAIAPRARAAGAGRRPVHDAPESEPTRSNEDADPAAPRQVRLGRAGRARFRSAAQRARPQAARAMGREMRAARPRLRPRPRLAGGARDRDADRAGRRAMAPRSTTSFDESIYLAPVETLLDDRPRGRRRRRAAAARRPQSRHGAAGLAAVGGRARCATRSRAKYPTGALAEIAFESSIGARSRPARAGSRASSARASWPRASGPDD